MALKIPVLDYDLGTFTKEPPQPIKYIYYLTKQEITCRVAALDKILDSKLISVK